jgi:hypothetical protein
LIQAHDLAAPTDTFVACCLATLKQGLVDHFMQQRAIVCE